MLYWANILIYYHNIKVNLFKLGGIITTLPAAPKSGVY